jgi:hypothetical protein
MKRIRNRLILIAVLTAAAVYFALLTLTKDQAGYLEVRLKEKELADIEEYTVTQR